MIFQVEFPSAIMELLKWKGGGRAQEPGLFIFFFWLYCRVACGILIPPLGIEPAVLALGAWGLNHWATGGGSPDRGVLRKI